MSRTRKSSKPASAALTTIVSIRLYIAGSAPNSVLALANLDAILRQHLDGMHKLEIVDVLEQPLRAMADGVLVTPSLNKLSPPPVANLVGNLSDTGKVLLALGITGKFA